MAEKPKRGRGGDVKRNNAPPGYYTAAQAQQKLGMNGSTFRYYVRQGKIKRHVPPLRREGFYAKKEIEQLATQMELFLHTVAQEGVSVRVARPEDTDAIVEVLTSMGWKTASAKQRRGWYEVNNLIDYVVVLNEKIVGYIHAVPYRDAALADMMSGRKRSWHITPQDIIPYTSGTYDLYIGIATRQDVPNNKWLSFRLIAGFLTFLGDLGKQEIHIHRMHAVSAEPDGQRLCRDLGFIEQPAEPDDLFPRFILDLETSDSRFAKRYRESIQETH